MQYRLSSRKWILILCFLLPIALPIVAQQTTTKTKQKVTKVRGKVIDAQTKEPLPFVNVAFVGTTVGSTTDFEGNYLIESQWASPQLMVSYLGYDSDTIIVELGKSQRIDFSLTSSSLELKEITIAAKKKKYRKKNNPAVELIRNVIRHKKQNRLSGQEYFEYDKYEKMELDLNNITDKLRDRSFLTPFQFVFENMDTSEINGKPYLPIFIQETSSTIYYRQSPKTKKEHRKGVKMSGFKKYWDNEGIAAIMDMLYQEIDIYENNIDITDVQFVSPLSPIAPEFYRFYIMDTVMINGKQCVDLAFLPRNKMNFGFRGNIWVTLDGNYTVIKLDLGITEQISMNWIDDLKIIQEFQFLDGAWVLNVDKMIIDFKITKKGLGFYGRRSAFYNQYVLNRPPPADVFEGTNKRLDADSLFTKSDSFWQEARPVPLTINEQAVYEMVDTIQTIPAFNFFWNAWYWMSTGYVTTGPIDIGPSNGFYSFTNVEGHRFQFGAETNVKFHKKIKLQAQGMFTTRDKAFKYSGYLRYSFNKDHEINPKHEIRLAYRHNTGFPGFSLNLTNEDNFLLSFQRGITDKMFFTDAFKFNYLKELESDFSYELSFEHKKDRAIGNWAFTYFDGEQNQTLNDIKSSEVGIKLRWAPNEEFLQARDYRYPIPNKHPIFTLQYHVGIKDVLQSDYNYQRLTLNAFKKFNFSILGYAHVDLEAGKIFGELPYSQLFLAPANQTYSYQIYSYNMMNFLEFVSDEYISLNARYYLNGFLTNKIPLLRKLKLREIVTVKMLYGRLTDKNNPAMHPGLVQFPTDAEGNSTTFTLEQKPYIELGLGIGNIFRVLTFDFVKRVNYLDHPNVPQLFGIDGLGIRFRVIFEF